MNYYKYILGVSFVVFAAILGYTQGTQNGKEAASIEYSKAIEEHREAISRQAELLNVALNKEVTDYSIELRRLRGDYQEIYKTLKNAPKPIIIGECTPSEEYIKAREVLLQGVAK